MPRASKSSPPFTFSAFLTSTLHYPAHPPFTSSFWYIFNLLTHTLFLVQILPSVSCSQTVSIYILLLGTIYWTHRKRWVKLQFHIQGYLLSIVNCSQKNVTSSKFPLSVNFCPHKHKYVIIKIGLVCTVPFTNKNALSVFMKNVSLLRSVTSWWFYVGCTAKYFELFPAIPSHVWVQYITEYCEVFKKSQESVIKMLLFTGTVLTIMVNLMAMTDMLVAKKAYQQLTRIITYHR